MAIDSKIPEIAELRMRTETTFGKPLKVHSDFAALRDNIFSQTKEHISETTLERLWNYSTRGYATVTLRSLNVLCAFIGAVNWEKFVASLREEEGLESDLFDMETVRSADLRTGDRLQIGWQPDRECLLRYLGDNRFEAEETRNSKLKPGDTFTCSCFQLFSPAFLEFLKDETGKVRGQRYGIGLKHGLTRLRIIKSFS